MWKGCVSYFDEKVKLRIIGLLYDPVTWYGINYAGTQVTHWDLKNKGTRSSPARYYFVFKLSLFSLRPRLMKSVPFHRIVQRAYQKQTTVDFALGFKK